MERLAIYKRVSFGAINVGIITQTRYTLGLGCTDITIDGLNSVKCIPIGAIF